MLLLYVLHVIDKDEVPFYVTEYLVNSIAHFPMLCDHVMEDFTLSAVYCYSHSLFVHTRMQLYTSSTLLFQIIIP